MNYRNFDISISPVGRGFRAEADGQYRGASRFKPPYKDSQAEAMVRSIEELIELSIKSRPLDTPPKVDLEEVGRTLYESLTEGRVGQALNRAIGNVEGKENEEREGLRLRLLFRALDYDYGSLLALPWELLWDPFAKDFLSSSIFTPVIRYLDAPRPIPPADVLERVRMLVVDCAPSGLPHLDQEKERKEIKEALAGLPSIEIEILENPQLTQLRQRLIRDQIHILHMIAHGGFDEISGQGVLALTDTEGEEQLVIGADFAFQLQDCRDLRLVFLNSCSGAALPRRRGHGAYGGVASALVKGGVAAALAMQFSISNRAAICFSREFYRALASGDGIDTAVAHGRLAIRADQPSSWEWITPVLFMRAQNSRIFRVDEKMSKTRMPPEREVYLAVRSAGRIGIEDDPEGDNLLDLSPFFEYSEELRRTYIRSPKLWNSEIWPRLQRFLDDKVVSGRLNRLGLPAQVSIAFAAGYNLEAKRGLDMSIVQRGMDGTRDWRWHRAPADAEELFWSFRDLEPREEQHKIGEFLTSQAHVEQDGSDVAVAISVARDVEADVALYLKTAKIPVSRILSARIAPGPSQNSVRDWEHSIQLAQQLETRIRARSLRERAGMLHIFAAAPNVLTFHLGQLSRGFGPVLVYEYDLARSKPGDYSPGIQLGPANS